ncbi:hypothetical protein KSC_016740 [Ktedonobacter sp. SOSP1-52]|nr:hypothetical protein KSC_016740 [Ktedonobacter sp. SOSP1-52]
MLVVMEATEISWLTLATFLARLGYAVSIVNPAQAHHFAKAHENKSNHCELVTTVTSEITHCCAH